MTLSEGSAAARAQYARQAHAYTTSASHAKGPDLQRLIDLLDFTGDEYALDVATGTGHTALAITAHCREVIAMDPTLEMLREAEQLAEARSITNIRFVQGEAEQLPFADSAFDVVTVRRAPHHFQSIPRAIAEMHRVLRPNGRLGLVDQLAPEDPDGYALQEEMERRRDPSHQRALTVTQWRQVLAEAGFAIEHVEVDEELVDFEGYYTMAGTPSQEREAILELIGVAAPSAQQAIGFHADPPPHGSFLKQRIVALAVRES